MLLPSCLIALVVLAALSAFILLKSKYGKSCSGNYQPRKLTGRYTPEANMPELVDDLVESDGLHILASAFCCVAAGAHSKDPAHQEQIAATFYDLCCTGFEGVKVDPAVKLFVDGLLDKAKKK